MEQLNMEKRLTEKRILLYVMSLMTDETHNFIKRGKKQKK